LLEYDLSIYSDPALAERERERIFGRLPVMAAHASQLPEPNSFITLKMNHSNVLLTGFREGRVKAFLNVCRHRGATLVDAPDGRRRMLTCKYLGWSYANDGELKAITFPDSVGTTPCGRGLVE